MEQEERIKKDALDIAKLLAHLEDTSLSDIDKLSNEEAKQLIYYPKGNLKKFGYALEGAGRYYHEKESPLLTSPIIRRYKRDKDKRPKIVAEIVYVYVDDKKVLGVNTKSGEESDFTTFELASLQSIKYVELAEYPGLILDLFKEKLEQGVKDIIAQETEALRLLNEYISKNNIEVKEMLVDIRWPIEVRPFDYAPELNLLLSIYESIGLAVTEKLWNAPDKVIKSEEVNK